jgi:hypothetical protein
MSTDRGIIGYPQALTPSNKGGVINISENFDILKSETINNKTITTAGLVLWVDPGNPLSYSGSGTTVNDLSGNGINGSLVNGVGYSSSNLGVFTFDGSNDGIRLSENSKLSITTMTISSWHYSTNYNQNGFLFEKTTNGSVNTQYSLFYNASNQIYYRFQGVDDMAITTSSFIPNSAWHNVVATYDGTNKRIYVDGTLVGTKASAAPTTNIAGTSFIGAYGDIAGYYFNGQIGPTFVYNRALAQGEIVKNFNVLRGRYGI